MTNTKTVSFSYYIFQHIVRLLIICYALKGQKLLIGMTERKRKKKRHGNQKIYVNMKDILEKNDLKKRNGKFTNKSV